VSIAQGHHLVVEGLDRSHHTTGAVLHH
jgi:hypothetical protein